MAINDQLKPTKTEVKEQLQQILRSDLFAHRKPGEVLYYVVNAVLEGAKKIETKDIVINVFNDGRYGNPESSAKFNASEMRSLIIEYYNAVGECDLVKIKFREDDKDKGKKYANYMPSFEYHPQHQRVRDYLVAAKQLNDANPDTLRDAVDQLQNNPLPQARLSYLEGLATLEFLHLFHENFSDGVDEAADLLQSNPDNWRTHAVLATLYLSLREIDEAAYHFENAMECNPSEACKYGWYHAFLFATGRTEQALPLVRDTLTNNPLHAPTQAIGAFWFYSLRMFEDADEILHRAWMADRNSALHRIVTILKGVSQKRFILQDIEDLMSTHGLLQGYITGLAIAHTVALSETPDVDVRQALSERLQSLIENNYSDLQEVYNNKHSSNPATWVWIPWPFFQLAFIAVGKGEYKRAIKELELAWTAGDPLVMWLHMMPIFDPLLKYDSFQALLKRRLEPPPPIEISKPLFTHEFRIRRPV